MTKPEYGESPPSNYLFPMEHCVVAGVYCSSRDVVTTKKVVPATDKEMTLST